MGEEDYVELAPEFLRESSMVHVSSFHLQDGFVEVVWVTNFLGHCEGLLELVWASWSVVSRDWIL